MLATYYKTAVRNIARSRFHSVINIAGLSVGIAFTLLIAAFCWSESRVNHQLRHADRQYFLQSKGKNSMSSQLAITTLGQLAKALKDNYPSLVANYYRWDGINSTVSYGDKHFKEGLQVGDSTLLTMYGFSLAQGDPATALNNPFSVVITEEKAIKYFGRTDVVGQNLVIDNFSGSRQNFRITGVMRKPSRNSVTVLNDNNDNGVYIPAANLNYFGRNMDWPNTVIVSYVELQKGVKPEALEAPIKYLIKANVPAIISENMTVVPVPLTDYYLSANNGLVRKLLFTLSSVALFILAMAVINFINLSVSRSNSRMKEIGIRKVLGSLRHQLRVQFLTESILLAAVSTVIALAIFQLCRPFFAGMLGSAIPSLWALPVVGWGVIALFAVVTGWLAGLYPAVLLSSLSSIDALKSKVGTIKENVWMRKGLVGFQFATATVVFVGAIIIAQQIRLFFSDRLGYDKEYVVSASVPRDWTRNGVRKMETIRDVFRRMPDIRQATLSYSIPNGMGLGSIGTYREGTDSTRSVLSDILLTDEQYAGTYQIPMAAGIFFCRPGEHGPQDTLRMVVNETAARGLGYPTPAAAIGQRVRLYNAPNAFTICGVVRDFHFNVMGAPIRPEIFTHLEQFPVYRYFSFKLRPGNIGATIEALQKQWAALMPGAPFEYTFMDETLQSIYKSELRMRKAATTATVLSFIIVLLGVLGLVSNSVRRRTKEIAIRKVIGASAKGIVRLFVGDYLPVLVIAGLIASPFAYWLMQRWLDNYATRITITAWPFLGAIGCLAVIMIALIAVQTIRAALANPVKSLRSE
ncbi:MAG TPA: ABC transporter permease [Puia sp.]|uniref:ABC transporter permease n=1 Tax=Puia sp. TaxID=2045100 RepID=UPI002CFA2E5E|nr:ABC transporter permease [Puia sp.]HVU95587.1 ABC transporter permease [Puia sp.]